jgi:hypothetical protein
LQTIAPLIEGRVVVYKDVEYWNVPRLHIAPELEGGACTEAG